MIATYSYVYGGWSAMELAVPKMMTVESATLVVLAASLLVFRTFRERYLLIWILGWLAYFVSGWTLHSTLSAGSPELLVAISQSQFILAVSLFACAVFVYSHARKLLFPLLVFSILSHCAMPRPAPSFGRIRLNCEWVWKWVTASSLSRRRSSWCVFAGHDGKSAPGC